MNTALTDALKRIETAYFTEPVNVAVMQPEVRAALRQARDAVTDAQARYAAQVAALNTAPGLRE